MSSNIQIIKDVSALLGQFDHGKDAELLRQAYQKLEGISLYKETIPADRQRLRTTVSGLWIRILNDIDENLPSDFDPEKTVSIQAPTVTGRDGTEYPPGTDPHTIKDAKDRSTYITVIANHRKEQQDYRLRMQLTHVNEQISESAKHYFIVAYPLNDADQREKKMLIEKTVKRADRKAMLLT